MTDFEDEGGAIYIHSSAGGGRAAWVGACMLSLLQPESDKKKVLEVVQSAHLCARAAAARPLVARHVSEAQHVPSASARAAYPSLSSLAMD